MDTVNMFCKIKISTQGWIEDKGFWTGTVAKHLRHREAKSTLLVSRPGRNITTGAMRPKAGSSRQTDLCGHATEDQLSCGFLLPQPKHRCHVSLITHTHTRTMLCSSQRPWGLAQCVVLSPQWWMLLKQSSAPNVWPVRCCRWGVAQLALQDIRLAGALGRQGRERVLSHDLPNKAPFPWNLGVKTAPTSDKFSFGGNLIH